jgi:hypothetical protein
MQELREAITTTQYSTISPDQLLIAAPEELIFLTICTLLQPGDTCIVTFPGMHARSGFALVACRLCLFCFGSSAHVMQHWVSWACVCPSAILPTSLSRAVLFYFGVIFCHMRSNILTVLAHCAGYQSLYEVARSRGVNIKYWEPRYTGIITLLSLHTHA